MDPIHDGITKNQVDAVYKRTTPDHFMHYYGVRECTCDFLTFYGIFGKRRTISDM